MKKGHPDKSQKCLLVLRRFLLDRCIKNAISVRGGLPKSTSVVDTGTALHDVLTDTLAFSPSVLITCSICSYHQAQARAIRNGSRHMTQSQTQGSGDWWRNVSRSCAEFGAVDEARFFG